MLYLSSRSKTDSFTAHRALHDLCPPDGGCFVPMRLPFYEADAIEQLKHQSFGENVAQILNIFFPTGITGWDVDCMIGKNACNITSTSRRVIVASLWNNPKSNYNYLVEQLYNKLADDAAKQAPKWPKTAIRIAVLFGMTGELAKIGVEHYDVSVPVGDFTLPMAAWYARKMGLPVGKIICSCNENSAYWDLLHRGELDTGYEVIATSTQELDVIDCEGLESLVYGALGAEESCRFVNAVQEQKVYSQTAETLTELNNGFFVSVVGKNRVEPVINSVYRSCGVVIDPYTAVAYGGLQDYRSKTGENRYAVLISDRSPMNYPDTIMRATGLGRNELKKYI